VRRLRVTEARTILFSALPEVYYYECSRSSLEKVLYDARSNAFLDVAIRAHVGFSMGLKWLSSRRFSGKNWFSSFIVSLAVVELFTLPNLCLNSVCHNVTVFLYGVFGYGKKRIE